MGTNRDLTLTPHVYTGVLPAIEADYRQLDKWGAFHIGGFFTYGTIESVDPEVTSTNNGFRGYFEANGKAQLDPYWSITTSLRAATDKTLTRRYDITNDDRLRNVVNVERISPDSYVTIAGWAFEGLRAGMSKRKFRSPCPRSMRVSAKRICLGEPFRSRRTACRSSASRDRTRSARSPVPNGTSGG